MSKIPKDKIPPNPKRRLPPVGVRFTPDEYELICRCAFEYAEGNVSRFIRHATLELVKNRKR